MNSPLHIAVLDDEVDITLLANVGRLRKKLEADAEDPKIIESVRGAGYILVLPGTPS